MSLYNMELEVKTGEWFVDTTLDNRPSDIVVCVAACHYHLHKDVLMESCDYFKAMFSSHMVEYTQDVVTIKLIEKIPFEILIKGFYAQQLSLTEENIFEVILAAHILQVSNILYKQCCDFMISLIDLKKCFEILHFSQFHNLQEVYNASRRYCAIHFSILYRENSFLTLTLDQVTSYLHDEFLIAEGEFEKVRAFIAWSEFNGVSHSEAGVLQQTLCKILHCTVTSPHGCTDIAQKLSSQENIDDHFLSSFLNTTMKNQDLMMFWARLSESEGEGLVDVVKLNKLFEKDCNVTATKVDTMMDIVEKPGFDLGSAVCCKGPYVYVCGGGPKFGRMDWIRDIWRYSILEDSHRWRAIGKLPHPLKYHAMVPVDNKLYVFGGFGKFRSKNCTLESFDISTGLWSQHGSVPTWEVKPIATHCHQTILYICREWTIYAYDTRFNDWTSLNLSRPVNDMSFNPYESLNASNHMNLKLLSCFVLPFKTEPSCIKLIVLCEGNEFQTHSFAINLRSKSAYSLKPKGNHNYVDMKTHKYLESCVFGDRVVVLFKTVKKAEWEDMESDEDSKEMECTPVHVYYVSSDTGQLSERFQLNNVVKMQSILAVPFVPKTFDILSYSLLVKDASAM